MSKFLAVLKVLVVDQVFVAGIPGIPEVPAVPEVLDVDGVTVLSPAIPAIPAIPAVPEIPLATHEEIAKVFIEDAASTVAMVLSNPTTYPMLKYYAIDFNPSLRPTLKDVREKSRSNAPVKEIVTIETTDGTELGSGVV